MEWDALWAQAEVAVVVLYGVEHAGLGGDELVVAVAAHAGVVADDDFRGAALLESGDNAGDDRRMSGDAFVGGSRGEEIGLDEHFLAGDRHAEGFDYLVDDALEARHRTPRGRMMTRDLLPTARLP